MKIAVDCAGLTVAQAKKLLDCLDTAVMELRCPKDTSCSNCPYDTICTELVYAKNDIRSYIRYTIEKVGVQC